ncbi:hypothetical protein LL033_11960 [Clostridium estertheticum]|uniref:hypothetical protein n=1 Tax=Clostridium estertheticum TaxID=238834 RepID=UPI001C0B8C93|nr:hypothetical protein [Clostridium estertheticum]MBU3215866.1 hypothetical protein [Clostridium estertheticum]WAG57822.1 hypothetical protein LL033_11960 [Clostridium estertheticum]
MNDGVKNAYNNFKKKYGVDVIKRNLPYKAILVDDTSNNFIKNIQMEQSVMKFGDYIDYYDESANRLDTYIVHSKVLSKLYYDESEIRQCTEELRYNATIDGVLGVVRIPTIVFNGTINVTNGTYFDTLDNTITCEVGASKINEITPIMSVTKPFRFILNHQYWKVQGAEGSTNFVNGQGTIFIKLISANDGSSVDDKVNQVAYNETVPIVTTNYEYTLTSDKKDISLENTRNYQTNIVCTRDNLIQSNPVLSIVVGDSSICTMSSDGEITGLSVGSTVIVITYYDKSITLNVTISAKVEIYTLTGNSSMNDSIQNTYKIIDESGVDSTLDYTFTISDESLAQIVSTTNSSVILVGKNIEGNIVLTVTNKLTGQVYTQSIQTHYNAHTYTIDAIDPTSNITVNTTYSIVANCTEDGVASTPSTLTYSSSDTSVAIVSNGVVTGLSVGNAIITCNYMNVSDTITVNIIAEVLEKSYKIVTSTTQTDVDTVSLGYVRTQKIVNSDLTVITTGEVFTFTLEQSSKNPSITPSQLIVLIDNVLPTSCRLNPNTKNVIGYFWLVAETNGIISRRELRVKYLSGN